MSFISQLQAWCLKYRFISVFAIVLLCVAVFVLIRLISSDDEEAASTSLIQQTEVSDSNATAHLSQGKTSTEQQAVPIVVDVKGAVKHPNTYQMMSDDRMKQLIDKAGVLPNADLTKINLVEKLTDQKMIYIPQKGEQVDPSLSAGPNNSNGASPGQNQVINLNTAQLNDLTNVPGIGPAKAQAILAYREEKGQFQSVEELKEVKGIGDKTYENLSSYFTV
ncbi:helix-hairpin-helix domain-containing protein [Staphylococcus sp. IVB6240]|uniref:helix-hairpin-helix domain-containing protein n=1 Tax=Staphylococcus sp. IVB6240 TaxID=2989771 RepID=UPI0021D00ECF|nr:helix-hairpin-helix domain-containing protein [Staphylococcus sp. IVB6240]UXR70687.1 helix-hairpin-helix domain-containing protein [Staphylococcus sp. IVB6240]